MRSVMRPLGFAVLAGACIAAAPRASAAQSDAQIAAMGCRNAASAQLRAQQPGSEPTFTAAPQIVGRKRGEVRMRGEGQYLDAARQPRRFTYDCAYRPHSAKTAISLSFPDTVAKPRD